eukprot:2366190-Amphidinium_carterae.1
MEVQSCKSVLNELSRWLAIPAGRDGLVSQMCAMMKAGSYSCSGHASVRLRPLLGCGLLPI